MDYDGQILCGADTTQAASGELCKWPALDVLWTTIADLPGFGQDSFRQAAETAWGFWSSVCGIRPKYTTDPAQANILIGLQTIGPGGVLADSELPCGFTTMSQKCRQRYDTAEAWVVAENPPPNRVDLVRVMCHELGHAIGIPHIGTGNLMAPVYSGAIRRPTSGDIAEAVARYGLPSPVGPGPIPEPGTGVINVVPFDPALVSGLVASIVRLKSGEFRIAFNGKLIG